MNPIRARRNGPTAGPTVCLFRHLRGKNCRRTVLCAIATFFICQGARVTLAQTAPLSFEPTSRTPPVVEDRPTITEWVASVRGTGLVEGRIELKLTAIAANMSDQYLGTVLTEELVFSSDHQLVRIALPPFHWSFGAEEILVRPRLYARQGVIELPEQRLRAPLRTARKFPLLMSETKINVRTKPGDVLVRDKFGDRLRFESLLPEEISERTLTVIQHLDVTEFPQEPLAYCQFELVVISGEDFSGLRAAQLDALLRWVRAGGKLCLEPGGILTAAHADFLNQLAQDDDRKLVFALDDQGRVAGSLTTTDAPMRISCGLGRVLLGFRLEQKLLPDDTRPLIAWIWQVRDDQIPTLLSGQTPVELQAEKIQDSPQGYYFGLPAPVTQDVISHLLDWLRPAGVRMVPLWVIGSLLGALVLWIGPVDYFLLGLVHRRKWTWFTFPAAVLSVTLMVMLVTNGYLSTAESRRALVVHDVASGGEILRTNRFELIFTSSTRHAVSDLRSSLFAPLLTGGNTDPRTRGYRQQIVTVMGPNGKATQRVVMVPESGAGQADAVAISGRIPSRYQVGQEIRQWTPQLNRSFTIGPADDAPPIDWSQISIPVLDERPAEDRYQPLLSQIRHQFGAEAAAAVLEPNGDVWSSDPPDSAPYNRHDGYGNTSYRDPAWEKIHNFPASARMNSLLRLTSAPSFGLFTLVNQAAPNGGGSLDDLPLAVTKITDRRVLLVLIPKGDDFVVYRQSYPVAR